MTVLGPIHLGDVRVHVLSDGTFAIDGGAMFGVVPRVIWEKTNPPDEANRIALGLNILLVETGARRILVDTGMGDKWGEKEVRMYRIDRSSTLLGDLHSLGLGPEDIEAGTLVLFYHDARTPLARVGKVDGRYVVTEAIH